LIIMFEAPARGSSRRMLLTFGGLLAAVCGAWLVVGPVAWPVVNGSAFFASAATPTRSLAYWLAYSLGPGGLLLALGAFVLGRPRTAAVVAPGGGTDTYAQPVMQPAQPVTAEASPVSAP
jgi:hypothetical protein